MPVRKFCGVLAASTLLILLLGGCVFLITALTADFSATPTVGAAGFTVQFTEIITINPPNAPITSRVWDFGDGTTSSEANPTHTYATAGIYTVSLTVTAGVGNAAVTDSETKADYIKVASAGGYVPPPPGGTGSAADINTAIDNAGPNGLDRCTE